MTEPVRKIMVSSALPYANGDIHMGHLVEYIQSDIWARFQKLRGHKCTYVCAADAHGTPIMIKAREQNITPEALVKRVSKAQHEDLQAFDVAFDNFYTTHSEENEQLVCRMFKALRDAGHIYTKTIEQAFDVQENMFLPDRFVRGTCPRCKSEEQYGDACEVCGATYTPNDLIDPISVLSGTDPVWKESEHYFFRLSAFDERLRQWIDSANLHQNITSKLEEWFAAGLRDWDISRDAPYFGFLIPGTDDKYFYVWLDAPMGYVASFLNLANRTDDLDFDEYWMPGHDTEVYHFIGKDIIYFHALFWPAVLHGAGYRIPTAVLAHGFLTVNGAKMSKTRGTFITARTYLEYFNAEYLRYYFAGKLGPGIDDLDLNLEDFRHRVNSDVVGKVVNIASRCAGFVQRIADGKLATELPDPDLFARFSAASEDIADAYEKREYSRAIRKIMELADDANRFIDENKPWVLAKSDGNEQKIQAICTQGLNHFRQLCIYLKPVMPELVGNAEEFLQTGELSWDDLRSPQLGSAINPFKPLAQRIESADIEKMIQASQEELAPGQE